ncbi:hypothetical protein PO909_018853 [Leuciscus waleckii]
MMLTGAAADAIHGVSVRMAVERRLLPFAHLFLAPALGCGRIASGERSSVPVPEVDGLEGDAQKEGGPVGGGTVARGRRIESEGCLFRKPVNQSTPAILVSLHFGGKLQL